MMFTCELMADPVVASDGNTYERDSIQLWMKTHDVSPHTNTSFDHKMLIPNIMARKQIAAWCEENGVPLPKPPAAAAKAAAAGGGGAHTSSDVQQACKGAGAGVVHGLRARRVLVVRSGHEGLEDARHRCVPHSVGGAADGRGGMGARAGGVEGRRGGEQLCGSIQADTDANIQRITAQCL